MVLGIEKITPCYREFIYRYVSSSICIKQLSDVLPLELFLNEYYKSSIKKIKIDNIVRNRNKFISSLELLQSRENTVNEQLLIKVNGLLSSEKTGFRNHQSWIGKSKKNKAYIPPNPSKVIELIAETLVTFNHEKNSDPLTAAFYLYFRIIAIHPFYDANGRTARALFLSQTPTKYTFLCPNLHLTLQTKQAYNELCDAALSSYLCFKNSQALKVYINKGKVLESIFEKSKEKYIKKFLDENKPIKGAHVYSILDKLIKKGFLIYKMEEFTRGNTLQTMKKKGVIDILPIGIGKVLIISKTITDYYNEMHFNLIKGIK